MTTRFRRCESPPPKPGEYRRVNRNGQITAVLGCPGCGIVGDISEHTIDAEGRVTPSVDCPECEYHEVGCVLEGWAA